MNTPLTRVLVASLVLLWTGLAAAQATAKDVPFTYLEGQVVTTIDPAKHTDESSHHAVINMYDPLLYPKVAEDSMEPGPHVADLLAGDGRRKDLHLPDPQGHSSSTTARS